MPINLDVIFFVSLCTALKLWVLTGSGTVLSPVIEEDMWVAGPWWKAFFPLIVSALPLLSASSSLSGASAVGALVESASCRLFPRTLSSSLSRHPSLQQPFLTVSLQLRPESWSQEWPIIAPRKKTWPSYSDQGPETVLFYILPQETPQLSLFYF